MKTRTLAAALALVAAVPAAAQIDQLTWIAGGTPEAPSLLFGIPDSDYAVIAFRCGADIDGISVMYDREPIAPVAGKIVPIDLSSDGGSGGQDHVRLERHELRDLLETASGIARAPAMVDPQVGADAPAELLQSLLERRHIKLRLLIVGRDIHQHADAPHPAGLLRPRRERPRCCRAANKRNELAPPHGMYS